MAKRDAKERDDSGPGQAPKRAYTSKSSNRAQIATKTPQVSATRKNAPDLSKQNDIVKIYIGKDDLKTEFTVYKSTICHYSPYFRAAFASLFVEEGIQGVDYQDASAEEFALFIDWMYRGTFIKPDGRLPPCNTLVKLWILGDQINTLDLQNDAILALLERGWWGNIHEYNYIYSNTCSGSPLRKFLVNQIARNTTYTGMSQKLRGNPTIFPIEMLVDLVLAQSRLLTQRVKFTLEPIDIEQYMVMDVPES